MSDTAELLRRVRLALRQDDFAAALEALTELSAIAQQAGDHAALARHHGNLALIYHRIGRSDDALTHLDAALTSVRIEGDPAMEGGLLGNAGNILREIGRYEDAIVYLRDALALAVEMDDARGRGIWLGNLALVYDDLQQPLSAIPLHRQSIQIARDLHDLRGLAGRLANLAQSFVAYGNQPSALMHLQEAVMIYRDLDDKASLARQLASLGSLYIMLGERTNTQAGKMFCYQRAVEQYRESLSNAYDAGDVTMQANDLRALGEIFLQAGDYDQAINHLDTAYQMFSGLGIETPLAELEAAVEQARAARAARV